MTIIIQAPPDIEATLIRAAAQEGVSVEEYALQAILHKADAQLRRNLAATELTRQNVSSPTETLFAQWAVEDATDDPEELARRNQETDEMLENLRVNRMDFEGRTDFSHLYDDDNEIDTSTPRKNSL